MKLKEIRISGFRGIPPIDPPDLDLKFTYGQDQIRDILIFGPNAYGKSSIADALEWFFREQVRGSNYFENYTIRDNVHLNLGKPNYPDKAYIELVIAHNGQDHTVRKSIGIDGKKIEAEEVLAGLATELEKCKDEVIILDHDQFRQFVGAASKDKWQTFSSLIGYEELDYFRGGLDSLSQRSATDYFKLAQEKRTLEQKAANWQKTLSSRIATSGYSPNCVSLEDLETEFMRELEILLQSLSLNIPNNISDIDGDLWNQLRLASRPPDAYIQRTERIQKLLDLSKRFPHLDDNFQRILADFVNEVELLSERKANFDKKLLADFYEKGLTIMQTTLVKNEECPFCQTPFEWEGLKESVNNRLSNLALAEINRRVRHIHQMWEGLRKSLEEAMLAAQKSDLPSLISASEKIPETVDIHRAISLETFDESVIKKLESAVLDLNVVLGEQRSRIERKRRSLEHVPVDNKNIELSNAVARLKEIWDGWRLLREEQKQIGIARGEYQIKDDVIKSLRNIARSFREELGDFSGRVVELINDDVDRYYDALHPNDGVKPFLETQISGNQRSVQLKCIYQGNQNRDAATLLSESHRNSLGMAVMLAFMKYKRRSGSPIEFLVLDDVTQSFDVGHRLGLLHFLSDPNFPEIFESQIIFLTHDRTLADLVVRPGEQNINWLRYDIRAWKLRHLHIEPSGKDLLKRAKEHLSNGDDVAAAVYGRHFLETVYRNIVESANILMPYNSKPWTTKMDVYQKQITHYLLELWTESITVSSREYRRGIIDPSRIRIEQLNRSLRLLHFTVHDSDFLENPPSLLEIDTAIQAIESLRDCFTCPSCRNQNFIKYFHRLNRDNQGNPPKCKRCDRPLPADNP